MSIIDKLTRSLTDYAAASDLRDNSIDKLGKSCKVVVMFSRLFFCFLLIIFTSFCVVTEFAIAGKAEEIKEEVKQGVKETKEEFKKMPQELKKAGQDLKKKSEEVKKDVEADIEEGKKNIRSITK